MNVEPNGRTHNIAWNGCHSLQAVVCFASAYANAKCRPTPLFQNIQLQDDCRGLSRLFYR